MANLRDIRRRIKSVKNTSQITKAMQLVAAAKMKKAQDQAIAGRDYADRLNEVLVNLKENISEEDHVLLKQPGGKKELILVVSTDKGLCGGLNTNLLKKVRAEMGEDADVVTVGRKLRISLGKLGHNIVSDWEVADPTPFADAKPIGAYLTEQFLEGSYSAVKVAFTNFETTLTQTPWIQQLLPVQESVLAEKRSYEGMGRAGDVGETARRDYVFEPSPEGVLDSLLPLYINYQVYQMILEARASEHSSRMVAMKAATDNAEQMIKDLTLEYNKVRQAAITSELLEITTAMKAME
ncbi:MAG: ATP synthase F1 subunit gamma [Verrucomicrobiota bacterium]|nr:ATP synthase F1 subunit gamma [Verrucomicrobiota bacterium]